MAHPSMQLNNWSRMKFHGRCVFKCVWFQLWSRRGFEVAKDGFCCWAARWPSASAHYCCNAYLPWAPFLFGSHGNQALMLLLRLPACCSLLVVLWGLCLGSHCRVHTCVFLLLGTKMVSFILRAHVSIKEQNCLTSGLCFCVSSCRVQVFRWPRHKCDARRR